MTIACSNVALTIRTVMVVLRRAKAITRVAWAIRSIAAAAQLLSTPPIAKSFSEHIAKTMTQPALRDPIQATINTVTISGPKGAEYVLLANIVREIVACHLVHELGSWLRQR
jgi:hypothetical protein